TIKHNIKIFLQNLQNVFGPWREIHSQCGFRISKFHALLHTDFYIRRFGSPLNYFGGHLESALKHIVKRPFKTTSHKHRRIGLDLVNKYHYRKIVQAAQKEHQQRKNEAQTSSSCANTAFTSHSTNHQHMICYGTVQFVALKFVRRAWYYPAESGPGG
ncbi:MAG: hypothetical protein AAF389_00005, partial [Gemmatimonadota bacterium]